MSTEDGDEAEEGSGRTPKNNNTRNVRKNSCFTVYNRPHKITENCQNNGKGAKAKNTVNTEDRDFTDSDEITDLNVLIGSVFNVADIVTNCDSNDNDGCKNSDDNIDSDNSNDNINKNGNNDDDNDNNDNDINLIEEEKNETPSFSFLQSIKIKNDENRQSCELSKKKKLIKKIEIRTKMENRKLIKIEKRYTSKILVLNKFKDKNKSKNGIIVSTDARTELKLKRELEKEERKKENRRAKRSEIRADRDKNKKLKNNK